MYKVGLALGSNLGDKLANLKSAREALREATLPQSIILSAAIYQTAPIDCQPGDPDFFNTVIEVNVSCSPASLLELTQQIEISLGREHKGPQHLPRTIDIDILYYADEVFNEPHLTIPHPRIVERRFVLEPLAQIRPDLILPGQTESVSQLLKESSQPPLQVVTRNW